MRLKFSTCEKNCLSLCCSWIVLVLFEWIHYELYRTLCIIDKSFISDGPNLHETHELKVYGRTRFPSNDEQIYYNKSFNAHSLSETPLRISRVNTKITKLQKSRCIINVISESIMFCAELNAHSTDSPKSCSVKIEQVVLPTQQRKQFFVSSNLKQISCKIVQSSEVYKRSLCMWGIEFLLSSLHKTILSTELTLLDATFVCLLSNVWS